MHSAHGWPHGPFPAGQFHARPEAASQPLALWVGPEATVNRIGDAYLDQLKATGFAERLDDLDRLAALGAQRIRFPILWERMAPRQPGLCDWHWPDPRMDRLHGLGLAPIVGLLHHGSGPHYTHLMAPRFPGLLAAYAEAVARRYPWVDAYTPVNEPLTTARFSGLYGIWYPHARDDRAFVRILMHQVQATVLAMAAIRRVNPAAQLIQTDDVGYTHSTPALKYQADFENERRWLSFDLLLGRVGRDHALWDYLLASGATEEELAALQENPCPPDVIGLNTYVTSERFLDERLERYPAQLHGGNGRQAYADLEAVRVMGAHPGGFRDRLRDVRQRYGRPMAITEAHLGCTREEQMRWLNDAWQAALAERQEGGDVRAVTAWSTFGACDWDSLLTRERGHYESGLWDVRAAEPRPTGLHQVARQLVISGRSDHPVVLSPGWWRREQRWLYEVEGQAAFQQPQGPPVLVTGARGTLGHAFARICRLRGLPCIALKRDQLDIADPDAVRDMIERTRAWAIVNTAGFVRVDEAETDERHWRENVIGPGVLAQACSDAGIKLMTFSTDLVFDGGKSIPYVETDSPQPLNAYGRSKHAAEELVLSCCADALVVRTAAFFGPWDLHNHVTLTLRAAARGEPWRVAEDQFVSPTYVPHLVNASLDLMIDGEAGLWHLANEGEVNWAAFSRLAAEAAGADPGFIRGVPGVELGQRAPRPGYAALGSTRGRVMPSLMQGVLQYLRDRGPALGWAS
jgi:dTDP-4-dehydrorhamnose reductase